MSDNVNKPLVLKDCLLDRIDVQQNGSIMVLTILDRRWRWRNSRISGYYNQVDPNPTPEDFLDEGGVIVPGERGFEGDFKARWGPFVPGTKRHIEQLMRLCLIELGEEEIFLGTLPDQAYPTINWGDDNAAAALQSLAELINWRVCYNPFPNDEVVLAPLNGPFQLPTGLPVSSDHPGLNPADPPKSAVCVGGPMWIADYLPLELIGLEPNGDQVPIDKLSYKPKDGWGKNLFPGYYNEYNIGLGTFESRKEAADWANRYMFKTFRVKCSETDSIYIPEAIGDELQDKIGAISDRRRIILGGRVFTEEKDPTGQFVSREPWVAHKGYAKTFEAGGKIANYTIPERLTGISVDTARNLVYTPSPVYVAQIAGNDINISEAEIWLYTSFQIRDKDDLSAISYEKEKEFSVGLEGFPEVVRRPDIQTVFLAERNRRQNFSLIETRSNRDDVDKTMDYWLDASRVRYGDEPSTTRSFVGLYPIKTGIGIRQVTWSTGNGPPTTTMSVAVEHAVWLPSYAERRRFIVTDWSRIP